MKILVPDPHPHPDPDPHVDPLVRGTDPRIRGSASGSVPKYHGSITLAQTRENMGLIGFFISIFGRVGKHGDT